MARPKLALEDSPAWEIYSELCRFAVKHQAIPNMHAFWKYVMPRLGYSMKFGKYRYYWNELKLHGLIHIESVTLAVSITDLTIIEKDNPDLATLARKYQPRQSLSQIFD